MEKKLISVDQVAILCGGKGTRLKPTTDVIPKALVQLNGRPILDYIIEFYRARGLTKFILCVGHKAELVKDYYKNPLPGTEIFFSDAGEDARMLERIWAIREQMGERIFVSYCDTFIDLDLEGMMADHLENKAEVTIVSTKIRNPFGLLTFDSDNWVNSFVEKPLLNYYIGCFILERSALGFITPEMLQRADGKGLVEDFFGGLIERKKLAVFEHRGAQITFNTESERKKAEEYLGQFYTHLEDL